MIKILLFLVTFIWMEATSFCYGEILSDNGPTSTEVIPRNYEVYWNVPTFLCHKYGMSFEEVGKNYGIIQNSNDKFRGEKIVLLYDPGMFPALLKRRNGSLFLRNGGLPQQGNLQKHLNVFKAHLKAQIDKEFSGLAIIDFESWRPVFRQNWAALVYYKNLSFSIEHEKHPDSSDEDIEERAIKRFQKAGKAFMIETLKLAKSLRPNATWGYYAYPYCFNFNPHQPSWKCDEQLKADNNAMSWLWPLKDVLLPSVYLRIRLSAKDKIGFVAGRLQEAARIIKQFSLSSKILPYFGYKYQDQRDTLLSKDDIHQGFRTMLDNGASGHIIWGSSHDFDSEEKCQVFRDFVNNILGPAVLEIKELARELA